MNIHEFQTKEILQSYGIPVPPFAVVSSVEDARHTLEKFCLNEAVIKIQVHAGGRGKAGGVKIGKSRQEILDYTRQLLGMKLVNSQTGPEGVTAHQVLITELLTFRKEYYVGAVMDRQKGEGVLMISPEGGVEIEEIAAKHPEKIKKIPIGLNGKIRNYNLIELCKFMGWKGKTLEQGKMIFASIAKAFVETDASLLEINPLVETEEGTLWAVDAKLSVDDNALYRQAKIASFDDPTQRPLLEARAKKSDLAYIALEGQIGCMVNGAGLAMATMDIIKFYGGEPANFLDVGGGASEEKVSEGFKIILSDPKVKAILINIFGGIMNCVTLAAGVIAAAGEQKVKVPLIIRMEGTNVEKGKEMLSNSGLNIQLANGLDDAARRAVAATKG